MPWPECIQYASRLERLHAEDMRHLAEILAYHARAIASAVGATMGSPPTRADEARGGDTGNTVVF